MTRKVVITHWLHDEVVARRQPYGTVITNATRDSWPRAEVLERMRDADAMLAFMPDSIDAGFLEGCPRLLIIAGALKGCDNFDVDACTRRGVWLTIVPELLTVPTAELAIALMLALTRHVLSGDRLIRDGRFAGWRPILYGSGLTGKTLGLIGAGAVGRAIVERLAPWGMRFIYCDPLPLSAEIGTRLQMQRVELPQLLTDADFILPLTPLDASTRHLLDAGRLQQIKRGAFLINVGRGSLVDEEAVAEALERGDLAGYAADVFEFEDWARAGRPRGISPRLLALTDRTIFTPHLGSAVDEVRRAIALEAADSIIDVFEGRRPRGAVNSPPR
jgi:phosphonate dehydrogenase